MELTANVPHPSITGFITTIRYVDRAAILKKSAQIEQEKQPYIVLDPRTDKPWIDATGQPLVVWKPKVSTDFASDNLRDVVVTWTGLVLDGVDVAYAANGVATLLDERLDVDGSSWAAKLREKAYDRATFDPDSKTNGSAKQ